jgi:hypothetical protein
LLIGNAKEKSLGENEAEEELRPPSLIVEKSMEVAAENTERVAPPRFAQFSAMPKKSSETPTPAPPMASDGPVA